MPPQVTRPMSNGSPGVASFSKMSGIGYFSIVSSIPILREVLPQDLGLRDVDRRVGGVEHGLARASVAGRERARLAQVRGQGVDAGGDVSGHRRRQVLVGRRTGVGAELADQRAAVDGEVDRLAELDVALEERPARVEGEQPDPRRRGDEELRLVDAVPACERARVLREEARRPERVVGGSGQDPVEDPEADAELPDDAVEMVRPRPAVEAVALEHDALPGHELGDVVGRRARQRGLRALGVHRQRRGNGAERRPRAGQQEQELRSGLRQPDGQRATPRDDSRESRRLAHRASPRAPAITLEVRNLRGGHRGVHDSLERVAGSAER